MPIGFSFHDSTPRKAGKDNREQLGSPKKSVVSQKSNDFMGKYFKLNQIALAK